MVMGKSYSFAKKEQEKLNKKVNRVVHKRNFLKDYIVPLRTIKLQIERNKVAIINCKELKKVLLEEIEYFKKEVKNSKSGWGFLPDKGIMQTIPIMIVNRESEVRSIDMKIKEGTDEEKILLDEIEIMEEEITLRKKQPEYKESGISYMG